jgi:hypothetical protein
VSEFTVDVVIELLRSVARDVGPSLVWDSAANREQAIKVLARCGHELGVCDRSTL